MSHIDLRLTAFFILTIFVYRSSFATNYYVAPVTLYPAANDANTGTTLALPFASLAKAITKAIVAGDTIFVRAGTYYVSATIRISKSGNAAKHLVITCYQPDIVNAYSLPVFDFSAMPVASGNIGINISGSGYWDIYGLVIKGAGDNGMLIQNSANHIVV